MVRKGRDWGRRNRGVQVCVGETSCRNTLLPPGCLSGENRERITDQRVGRLKSIGPTGTASCRAPMCRTREEFEKGLRHQSERPVAIEVTARHEQPTFDILTN